MKRRVTPQAFLDITAIVDYLHERNPVAAKKVQSPIYNAIDLLVVHPYMGHKQRLKSVRKWVITKYPYLIYYKVDEIEEEVVIVSIYHQARQRPYDDAE